MSIGELLLVMAVAVVALGPKQIVVITRHFSKWMSVCHQGRAYVREALDNVLKAHQLDENIEKAKRAEVSSSNLSSNRSLH